MRHTERYNIMQNENNAAMDAGLTLAGFKPSDPEDQKPMMETEEFTGRATYSPEDNKLRLYVGRVPRPEYDALRAEGWICTPKQGCDFVSTWPPQRRDTALAYGDGVILDEDQSPAERAAGGVRCPTRSGWA